jgi:hypothetical protein
VGLAAHAGLIDTAATLTYVDMDDTIRRTYGYAKQGSGYGYSGVKGLNALMGLQGVADGSHAKLCPNHQHGEQFHSPTVKV